MKKMTALFTTAAMSLTALFGCANAFAEEGAGDVWTGEIEPIVVTLLNAGTDNPYLDQVAEKLNEYLGDKIGVEVSFRQVSVFNAASQYTMWIGGGETVDLLTIAFAPVSAFTGMNMLEPLDDLLQYAPHIQELAEEGYAIYCPSADGHIYGIRTLNPPVSNGDGMYFWKEDLEEAGLEYEDNQLVTLEDIDLIVSKVKELHPDAYVGVYGSAPRSGFTIEADPLGANITSGVILGTESTEVVNYFETEEYQDYIKLLRKWYEEGLVKKDAATTDALEGGSMTNDPENCRMMWNEYNTGIIASYEEATGKEVVALRTAKRNQNALTDTDCYTGIPVTCEHPEAAMRFLDMMYSDMFVENTCYFGIEGVNFDYTDETKTAYVANPDNGFWALGSGNRMLEPMQGVYKEDTVQKYDQFAEEINSSPTKGYGFLYDPANMTNQITAIDAVLQEYRAALETGSADIDTVYPEFIKKLKANGIDDVIADKQAQFDAWLAEN